MSAGAGQWSRTPPPPGLPDKAALELLVTDGAARAVAMLTAAEASELPGNDDPLIDAVRMLATPAGAAYVPQAARLAGFAEGETSKASDKYVGGKSTMGVGNYSGPCTPPGPPHHYTFVLIATDFETGDLPAGLTRDDVIAKFGPPPAHVKGSTGLIGLFVNPWHD